MTASETSQFPFNQDIIDAFIYQDAPEKSLKTALDYVRWCTSIFNRSEIYFGHGFENAWQEAQYLVAEALALSPAQLSAFEQGRLTQSEKQQIIAQVLERIGLRLPLAYITHSAWFCGLQFYVDERTIIPRSPISALIQDKFASLLKAEPQRILDLCTGGGCIALSCADAFPDAEVDAVDLSLDALEVAEINIRGHQMEDRVFPIQSDLFENLAGMQYDLIVSNPPYVDAEDLQDMPQEFAHEPSMALGSGDDGLDLTKQILRQAADYLSENGVLVCEVGNSMLSLMAQYPEVPFNWLELKNGGLGVFAIDRATLLQYRDYF